MLKILWLFVDTVHKETERWKWWKLSVGDMWYDRQTVCRTWDQP